MLALVAAIGILAFTATSFAEYWDLSPKKQIESGIAPEDVICKEDMQLAIRDNGGAVCLTMPSAQKMAERNMVTIVDGAMTRDQMQTEEVDTGMMDNMTNTNMTNTTGNMEMDNMTNTTGNMEMNNMTNTTGNMEMNNMTNTNMTNTNMTNTTGNMEMDEEAMARAEIDMAIKLFDESGTEAFAAITAMKNMDEFYPFVVGQDGTIVAHGANPEHVGNLNLDSLNANMSLDELKTEFESNDEVWMGYKFENPATGQMQQKHALLVLHMEYWFGSGYYENANQSMIELTEDEAAWLAANPVIRLAYDPAWPPIEYVDNSGNLMGLSAKYASSLGKITGAEFETIPIASWTDALEAIRNGSAHVIMFVGDTDERSEYMGFTEPHTTIPAKIITMENQTLGVDDLMDLDIATVKGYFTEEWLNASHPDTTYNSFDTPRDALDALSDGTMDAYIGIWMVADHIASKNGMEIYDSGDLGANLMLSTGFGKDLDVLGSILQKALDAIPEEQKADMFNYTT